VNAAHHAANRGKPKSGLVNYRMKSIRVEMSASLRLNAPAPMMLTLLEHSLPNIN